MCRDSQRLILPWGHFVFLLQMCPRCLSCSRFGATCAVCLDGSRGRMSCLVRVSCRPVLAHGLPPSWMVPSTVGPCGQPPLCPLLAHPLGKPHREGCCAKPPLWLFSCCFLGAPQDHGWAGAAGRSEAEAAVTGQAGKPRSNWLLHRCSQWPRRRLRQRAHPRPSAQKAPPGRARGAHNPPRAPSTWCPPL